MKYLLFTRQYAWQTEYRLQQFDTPAELTQALRDAGFPKDAIMAQRIGVQISVCEWTAPAVDTDAAAAELEEAA